MGLAKENGYVIDRANRNGPVKSCLSSPEPLSEDAKAFIDEAGQTLGHMLDKLAEAGVVLKAPHITHLPQPPSRTVDEMLAERLDNSIQYLKASSWQNAQGELHSCAILAGKSPTVSDFADQLMTIRDQVIGMASVGRPHSD